MRILITGGFGFVGGRLALCLAQDGHKLTLGTRHQISSPNWLAQAHVAKIAWDDVAGFEHHCKGVDVIIHAAGMNAKDCVYDPKAALEFNGVATARLVAAARRASVKKFIYLSTAHVYASPLKGVITEKTYPDNSHPYATSHLVGEQSVLNAHLLGDMQGIVLRLSNAFGVPMHKDVNCWMLLVNDLCRQAVQTRQLVLNSSGQQQRDFISLTDVCCVVKNLVDSNSLNQANLFNVGAGISQSVLEIAQLIQRRCRVVLGFTPKLLFKSGGKDEQYFTLTYCTNKLNALGITSKSQSRNQEIDQLLKFCSTSFN
jgi:UDP-glucose 4-epimerase